MEIKIKELNEGYIFEYPNIVNDIKIFYEEEDGHYVFRQLYNNFDLSSGEGGNREKIVRIVDKKDVKDPKIIALRVLQDVLISEVLPKSESLDFKILKD